MALLRSVLGTVTQSMGGVTATTWKGKNVLKQKVAATNTSNTPAQQKQRSMFAALATLGGTFGPAIRVGYRVAAAKVTEQNAFYTANKEAVTYANGVATVNYALLKLSTGIVGVVAGLDVTYTAASGQIGADWLDNSNGADALPDDMFYLVAVDMVTGKGFNGQMGVRGDAGGFAIQQAFPAGTPLANIRAYGFFKRATSTATSPSATALPHA